MRNALLVIGAGLLHCYTIQEAKKLGLYVIATDRYAHASGSYIADEFHPIDIYDIAEHRKLARALKPYLIGVTCAGGDAAPTVAACCEEAGLPGIPYDIACRTWNKYEVRLALENAGLVRYQPEWAVLNLDDHGDPYHAVGRVGGFPCIVKPLTQRASRGVHIATDRQSFIYAIHQAAIYGATVLIEEHLDGLEHSAEIIFDATGKLCHFHVCDRFFLYPRGLPLETGHINPSRLDFSQLNAIRAMLLASAHALGVTMGSWKCDVMMTSSGPKILECTARCSGGFDAQISYPRSSGDNLIRRVIQAACGLPLTPQPPLPHGDYCAVAAIIPRHAGIVRSLPETGTDEVIWTIEPGGHVQPPQHCAERAGFVITTSYSYQRTWILAHRTAQNYVTALEESTDENGA